MNFWLAAAQQQVGGISINIGDEYQGGYVAHIFESGEQGYVEGEVHGIIAGEAVAAGHWSNVGDALVGGTSALVGYGQANTEKIINQAGHTESRAKLCDELVSNGYSDWFMASTDEFYKIRTNLHLPEIRTYGSGFHWTSTEGNETGANAIRMSDAFIVATGNKILNSFPAIACRYF